MERSKWLARWGDSKPHVEMPAAKEGLQRPGGWPFGEDPLPVPPMLSIQHITHSLQQLCPDVFRAFPHKVHTFLRFLHLAGLIVHYGQEPVSKGKVERASPTSNKPRRGIVVRVGSITEADGAARPIKLSEVILRTVFLMVGTRNLDRDVSRALCPLLQVFVFVSLLFLSASFVCCVVQPQWLFHCYVRVMNPKFKAIRWGRRYGEDAKEDLLTYDPKKEARIAAEQAEKQNGLMAQRLAHRTLSTKPLFAVRACVAHVVRAAPRTVPTRALSRSWLPAGVHRTSGHHLL